jgi:ribosome maturation factor RimP
MVRAALADARKIAIFRLKSTIPSIKGGPERPTFSFGEERTRHRLSLTDAKHIDVATIEATIAPAMEAAGYRVVRIVFTGIGRHATLQIMAEHASEAPMTVDDCAQISHTVSALLDVADPIAASYMLEVSSPGLDRPLVKRQDFERFAGLEAKLEVKEPIDGRKRFRGRLRGVEGDAIALEMDGAVLRLPLSGVTRAKLVLTDELIAASRPRAAAAPDNAMERQ